MLGEQHRKRRLKDEKRIPLNLRTAPVIRQQLEAAAARSGRSLSQESELRLQQTFRDERVFDETVDLHFGRIGGDLLIGVVGAVFTAAREVCRTQHIEYWLDDAALQREAATTLRFLIGGEHPKPEPEVTPTVAELLMRQIVLRIMTSDSWVAQRRERLGPYADLIEARVRDLQERYESGPKVVISTISVPIESY